MHSPSVARRNAQGAPRLGPMVRPHKGRCYIHVRRETDTRTHAQFRWAHTVFYSDAA